MKFVRFVRIPHAVLLAFGLDRAGSTDRSLSITFPFSVSTCITSDRCLASFWSSFRWPVGVTLVRRNSNFVQAGHFTPREGLTHGLDNLGGKYSCESGKSGTKDFPGAVSYIVETGKSAASDPDFWRTWGPYKSPWTIAGADTADF